MKCLEKQHTDACSFSREITAGRRKWHHGRTHCFAHVSAGVRCALAALSCRWPAKALTVAHLEAYLSRGFHEIRRDIEDVVLHSEAGKSRGTVYRDRLSQLYISAFGLGWALQPGLQESDHSLITEPCQPLYRPKP